jgi:hypothetical protein
MAEKVQYSVAEADDGFNITDPSGVLVASGDTEESVTQAVRDMIGEEVDLVRVESDSTEEDDEDEDTPEDEVTAEGEDNEEEGEDAPESKRVPLAALQEERKKRQELESRLATLEADRLADLIPATRVNPLADLEDDDVLSVGQMREMQADSQFSNLQVAMDTYARSPQTADDPMVPAQAVQLVVSALKQNPEMIQALAAHPDPIGRIRATAIEFLAQTGKTVAGSTEGSSTVKEVVKTRTQKSLQAKKGVHPSLGKGTGGANLGDEITGHINRLANLDGGKLEKYMAGLGKEKRDEVLAAITNQRSEG